MNQGNELIRKIQLKELEILKMFQEICKRHNLRYFAIGGTCLGAVRHQGFIPWDDDVDVAMPYEDYVKFLELADSELPNKYGIISPLKIKHCAMEYFFKIHDKTTAFIENDFILYSDRYAGISIDIFPVHGLTDNEHEKKKTLLRARILRNMNRLLRHEMKLLTEKLGFVKGFIAYVTGLPLKLFLPFNYFTLKHERMLRKYKFGSYKKIIFPWRKDKRNENGWYTNIFPHDDFKETIELPFEDTTISVPVGYDNYLTMEFGDYMTLPPEDKRNNHMSYDGGGIVDLEKSYKYYAEQKEAGKLCS